MKTIREKITCPILISGYIGSGKSTLAKKLAQTYRIPYISASVMYRELMKERISHEKGWHTKISQGFWETPAGKKAMNLRMKDACIDEEVDARLLHTLNVQKVCVTDARLMPWLYRKKAIRIWLTASEDVRATRVGIRDDIPPARAKREIRSRLKKDVHLWKNIYGIPFGKDMRPFDLIVNNDSFSKKETFERVKAFLDGKIRGKN